MKLFVDANILVSVINKEYPLFTYSSRVLSLSDKKGFEVYTSPICLAIAFYFAEKKSTSIVALEKMRLLCQHLSIASSSADVVQSTLSNKKIKDFEDGLEYYSAIGAKCHFIITEDVHDFYFSAIPVLSARDFFEKHLASR